MSWSYSGDPELSPLDNVRFIIGDTKEEMALLQDEEIQFTLKKNNGDISASCVACLEGIVASLASQVSYSIGPEHVSAGDRYKHYLERLNSLKSDIRSAYTAPISTGLDRPACFDLGMNDFK